MPRIAAAGRAAAAFIPLLVFAAPMVLPYAALAQETPRLQLSSVSLSKSSEGQYRSEMLVAKISFWSGAELHRGDGRPVELGMFGGGYQEIFKGSEDALASMRIYRALKISGNVARLTGIATMVTQIALVASGQIASGDALFWTLLGSGIVLNIGGSVLAQGADSYLSDAIQQYNRDLLDTLDRKALHSARSSRFGLFYTGTF
jgi:hypothetical protein